MKYRYFSDSASSTRIISVYISLAALFFSVCDLTFNSITGLHPTLVSVRAGKYIIEDAAFVVIPVLCALASFFYKKCRWLALVPPVLLSLYALYCDSIDKTMNVKLYTLVPCAICTVFVLLTFSGALPSKWIAATVCAVCALSFIFPAVNLVSQLFYYKSGYNGYNFYISKLCYHILVLSLSAVYMAGLRREKTEKTKKTEDTEYEKILDGADTDGDALRDESKIQEGDDIIK